MIKIRRRGRRCAPRSADRTATSRGVTGADRTAIRARDAAVSKAKGVIKARDAAKAGTRARGVTRTVTKDGTKDAAKAGTRVREGTRARGVTRTATKGVTRAKITRDPGRTVLPASPTEEREVRQGRVRTAGTGI